MRSPARRNRSGSATSVPSTTLLPKRQGSENPARCGVFLFPLPPGAGEVPGCARAHRKKTLLSPAGCSKAIRLTDQFHLGAVFPSHRSNPSHLIPMRNAAAAMVGERCMVCRSYACCCTDLCGKCCRSGSSRSTLCSSHFRLCRFSRPSPGDFRALARTVAE